MDITLYYPIIVLSLLFLRVWISIYTTNIHNLYSSDAVSSHLFTLLWGLQSHCSGYTHLIALGDTTLIALPIHISLLYRYTSHCSTDTHLIALPIHISLLYRYTFHCSGY